MKERLGPSDYRFIAVCLALLVGATWFSAQNFYRAFPEASIDFRVSRDEALHTAEQSLHAEGYQLDGYRQAASFDFDDDAKTFLEREVGLEQASQIMGKRVRLWRWSYRWFRPLQKEEFTADVTPIGEFVEFKHEIAEDAPRPAASDEQARALAEDFLRTRMHRDLASLEFVEVSAAERPKRVDRDFTWKERDFNIHDASYRLEVSLLGNEVGGYREYLKVPEKWTRDYEHLRSRNSMAQNFDFAAIMVLGCCLVAVIVLRVRRQDVRWGRAALVGVVGMILSFCASLNGFPLAEFNYSTTDPYSSFVMNQLLSAALGALATGGFLFVLTAGAEPLYREAYPAQMSLAGLIRLRGLRSKRFFLGAILGITLAAIFFAYQIVFYLTAYHFGAWSPADVPYSDELNTRFPWLFVLLGGYLPAVSEEFGFRMFAIPFLRKATRNVGLAVVLAAFVWGFGHSSYPQQPFFIRGVEVGIGGVALGLIMLRWGILPTLVWHYSVDAMYSAMLLVRSHNLYFRLSGAASAGFVILPVLIALVAYWRRGGFEPATGLLNGDEPAPATPVEAAAAPVAASVDYRPLSTSMRLAAIVLLAVGLLSLLIPVSRFGASPKYKLTADQARTAADEFLRAQGLAPDDFRHVTFPGTHWEGDDTLAAEYFLERRPVSFAAGLFENYRPVHVWSTRYFKSLDAEGVSVSVHPETGKVLGFDHSLPEDRAGADISSDTARQIASQFAIAHGWDVSAMDLKESNSEKKKARRDHTLIWEARTGDPRNLDDTHFRVLAGVAGDQVTTLRSFWKIPEEFDRSRSREGVLSIAVETLRTGAGVAAVVLGLWLLVQKARQGLVSWRRVLKLAAVPAIAGTVGSLLSLPLALRDYETAIPLETFQVMRYTSLVTEVLFLFLLYAAAAALLTSFYPESLAAWRAGSRRKLAVDALAILLAAAGLQALLGRLEALMWNRFHAQWTPLVSTPDVIASPSPVVSALAGSVAPVLLFAATLVLLVVVLKAKRAWVRTAGAFLLTIALVTGSIHTRAEFALHYAESVLNVFAWLAFCRWFARGNYMAYGLMLWMLALSSPLGELFATANSSLQLQGWIAAAAAVAVLIWCAAPALGRKEHEVAAALV
jgi:membrane protease YdiL (CAAX protease family)